MVLCLPSEYCTRIYVLLDNARMHNRRGPYLGVVVVIGLNCSVDKVTGTASYQAWQLLWCRWLLLCASCGRRHKMDDFTIVTGGRLIESTGSGNAIKRVETGGSTLFFSRAACILYALLLSAGCLYLLRCLQCFIPFVLVCEMYTPGNHHVIQP